MAVHVIGHRGTRGLLPESSLPGFAKAIDLKVDMIELDIGITQDEAVVVHHDFTLNPEITRDCTGNWIENDSIRICDLTYEELLQYDIGMIKPGSDYQNQFPHQESRTECRIPTLEEVVSLVNASGQNMILCIEAKFLPKQPLPTHPLEKFSEVLANEIIRLDIATTSIIQSFDWQIAQVIQKLVPRLDVWHLTSQIPSYNTLDESLNGKLTQGMRLSDFGGSVPKMVAAAGGEVWSCDVQTLTTELVDESHELGLKVYCWTVNSETDFHRLYAAGIDGIITDYPDRLISFLEMQE